ncbi:MAG TPA: hypothetical protein VMA74_10705 [Dyella sp.]|uniref:CopG family ribbon-helix-helix protein n=1 Tax=Dyella sp. TaxID=1869338 RepID=UPI002C2F19EE|nr:hypothetical protein [Dyella sp.]HUB90179.1 hypothetical protein [Dyella sp.]
MGSATFTFRVDKDLKNAFSIAAKAHGCTSGQLLRDFMRDYVKQQEEASDYDTWLRAKVQKPQASADAGNLVPAVDVEARFVARRAAAQKI